MRNSLKAMLAAGALLTLGTFASPAAAQHACQGDAFRLCNAFVPDRGKVASCLFKNRRALSAECAMAMGAGKAKVTRKAKSKRYAKRKKRCRRC